MKPDKLQKKLSALPKKPGVYLFRDSDSNIIYIGKAKRLRNRVRSYFQDSYRVDAKLEALKEKISTFEYIITNSEVEALILEAQLIKEHKPKFNILLKDDKRFPLIKITREKYPRIVVARRIKKDGAKYFGPYTDSRAMRNTIRTIKKIFPLRSCKNMGKRPCLNYHINRCLGPCQGEQFKEEYHEMVNKVIKFLSGRKEEVLDMLKSQMMEASETLQYEKAARLRDQIRAIEKLNLEQRIVDPDRKDRDILAIAVDGDDACGVVMQVREGKLLGKTHYFLTGAMDSDIKEIFETFLRQYYLNALFIPEEIILQFDLEDSDVFEEWLSERRGGRVYIIRPQRGKKRYLERLAERNAILILEERRMMKENYKQRVIKSVIELQKALKLKRVPRVIEAFDISNIQGTDAVGSMVYFENGKPKKREYRRFKIKTVEERPNDFAMMKEVVTRRYRDLLERNADFPDLILIDGGKGQLSSAIQALRELGVDVEEQQIIGLAKRLEEVFLPGREFPIMIRRSSPALKLIQRVRDAAHDWAISYHRMLRAKHIKHSELENIRGVGERRKLELLKHFGSVKRIKKASVEELAKVRRIPQNVAQNIYDYFHN